MNQFTWTYIDNNEDRNVIGLAHSPRKGHLMIYCNKRILHIDFKVMDTRQYSFFVADELMVIDIEKQGNNFGYSCTINKEADTPLNRARRVRDRKHWRQALLFFGGLVAMVALSVFLMTSFSNKNNKRMASALSGKKMTEAVAKVNIEEGGSTLKYFFVAKGQSYTREDAIEKQEETIILDNGMPLESGDEFVVKYTTQNPDVHQIDYQQPTETQIDTYHQRAIQQYLAANPAASRAEATCLVKVAYELTGIAGLADFYFQKARPNENTQHNETTFKRLIRDVPFQQKVKERCR
jgi:hypothetical protein